MVVVPITSGPRTVPLIPGELNERNRRPAWCGGTPPPTKKVRKSQQKTSVRKIKLSSCAGHLGGTVWDSANWRTHPRTYGDAHSNIFGRSSLKAHRFDLWACPAKVDRPSRVNDRNHVARGFRLRPRHPLRAPVVRLNLPRNGRRRLFGSPNVLGLCFIETSASTLLPLSVT